MSYGTDFKAKVFLNREIYHNKQEIEQVIKEREKAIQTNRELLLMMSVANPKDLVTDDEDVLYATRNRVNDIIDDILDEQYRLTLDQLYLEAIEDGTAKFEEPKIDL